MYKKLYILLIFNKLKVTKLLIDKYRMHNLYAIFAKIPNICKQVAGNFVNESGNVPRKGAPTGIELYHDMKDWYD